MLAFRRFRRTERGRSSLSSTGGEFWRLEIVEAMFLGYLGGAGNTLIIDKKAG